MKPIRLADFDRTPGQRRRACWMCGKLDKNVLLNFTSGSVEPQVDETLTGIESHDTGVVASVHKKSGTWTAGDAAGYVIMDSFTGADGIRFQCFSDDENVSGSTGGLNILTTDGAGFLLVNGRLYNETEMRLEDGQWYCKRHWKMKFETKAKDEAKVNLGPLRKW